ncbi:MAG TPA: WhiB family transcriptional regulator [Pseudonocardiaceae bacterium]|jgi:WhiB family redox-sensing transcriptional regulator
MAFQPGDRPGDCHPQWHGDWRGQAACRDGDPDRLFVRGAAQREAKLVCFGCPVRTECLAEALDDRIEFGVWGGMTERERRALLRRRPDVQSWHELLLHARGVPEDAIRAG